jgi:hypothetical protein
MPRHRALPTSLHARPFAVTEAIDLGVGVGRLRGADLTRPFRAVRSAHAASVDIPSLARSYATIMPPDQYFSHWTAAALLGLRMPERATPAGLDVTVPHASRAPRLRGVRGHELLPSARIVTLPDGLRVSSAVDTWCQLSRYLGVDDLIVMGDGLVCRTDPVATMDELASAVAAWAHRPGVAALRRALPDIRARTDSARETMLRLLIVRAGLPEPIVNYEIRNHWGAVLGLGDLAYPEHRVLVEYDGGQHRENEKQFHRDVERLDDFMEEKWRVIRVNKELMARPAALIGKVRTALTAAGWRG